MRRPIRRKRKVCEFCEGKIKAVDYKEVERLERHLTERGKILPRRATGVCTRHQRQLSKAIKNARSVALLPYARL